MAMHKSEELAQLSLELVKQVQALGVATWFCAFNIYDEDPKGSLEWGSNGQGTFPRYRTPREGIFLRYYEAGQRGDTLLINEIGEDECPAHYDYLCSLPGVGEQLLKMRDSGIPFPTSQIDHVAYFKYGYILFITFEPAPEAHDIFKRFATVFEQTYTRFLDLNKAEEQAREAQIEASLERARAQSMMMQHSSELNKTSQVFHEQLHLLGIESEFSYLWLPEEDKGEHLFWATWQEEQKGQSNYKNKQVIYPLDKSEPAIADCYVAWESGNPVHVNPVQADGVEDYFNEWIELLEGVDKFKPENYPNGLYYVDAYMKYGCFGIMIRKQLSEDEQQILHRFSTEFERAYTRFLDLQKAEAQAREVQIELSLERIRAQVTAMKESSDLLDIVVTMNTEFRALGHEAHYFWHMRWLTDTYEKAMTSGDGSRIAMVMELPRGFHENPAMNAWEKNTEPLIVVPFDVEGAIDYIDKMTRLGRFSEIDHNAPGPDDIRDIGGLTFVMARTTHGEIGYSLPGVVANPPAEDLDTLHRFAGVFDLAYRRFEDLKDAEQRNRETQIELALERVRARTMSMHKTSELQDVINAVHQQFSNLNMNISGGAFIAINSEIDKELNCWGAGGTADYIQRVHIPFLNRPIYTKMLNRIKKGPGFFSEEFTYDEKIEFFKHLFKNPPYSKAPAAQKKEVMGREGAYTRSCIVSKHTSIFIINHHGRIFSDEENDILKRFGKVLEQSYTRFLDIQKAESQAREAQIEAALERVRAKSMVMQKSEELSETASLLYQELQSIEKIPDRMGIVNYDEENKVFQNWVTDQTGMQVTNSHISSIDEPTTFNKIYRAWKKNKDSLIIELTGNELEKWLLYVKEKMKLHINESHIIDRRIHYIAFYSYGFLMCTFHDPAKNNFINLLARFAKVFEQTYTRFLDLKQAEDQAREAQIEAALERVRSKTMAMHNSQDVGDTVVTLFEEVIKLGLDKSIRCGIGILEDTVHMETWSATSHPDGEVDLKMGLLNMTIHPMLVGLKKAWKSGKTSYSYDYIGEDVYRYYEALNREPEYPFNIDLDTLPENEYHRSFIYSEGILFSFAPNPISDEAAKVLDRFARVFGQTYRRYRDLLTAEVQAIEAIKQSSLDRVRGKIASMRSPNDLDNITPLIWSELEILEVPFIRCGVFIIDESKSSVQAHLTTPDGKPIGALNLPFDANELTYNTVEFWKKNKVYTHHWNKEDFLNWMQSMIKLGQIQTTEQYQGYTKPPESLDLHFIPFKQGMLYVGYIEPLKPEEIELVETLAEAFSIAYARYEDFVHLEEAKTRVEKTLSELKSAQSQLIHAEKMASLGELTAGIAHEIQNPLNFVNNFSEVSVDLIEEMNEEMESGDTKEVKAITNDLKQNLEKITYHGQRASVIVKGMLEHSRAGNGHKELTDINELADEYLRLAYHGLRAKDKSFNADFKTDLDETLPKVNVVPQDIGRVLLNLINNAFFAVSAKASETTDANYKPTVVVSTSLIKPPSGGLGVMISVKDNGSGIPDNIKDKIFQPFFTTKPTGEGTGLGLSLSFDILTKGHGGELTVDSKKGEGTEFIIKIPIDK